MFDEAVGSLDHPVGFGSVRPGQAMLDFGCSDAVLEAVKRELAPIVGEDLFHLKRKKRQRAGQKVGGGLLVFVWIDAREHQAGRAVNGDKTIVLLPVEFGQVETVDMKVAGAILLESAHFSGGLLLLFDQTAASVSHQEAMQAGTVGVW